MEDDKTDQTKKRKAPDCDQWRQNCIAGFGLEPLPWTNDGLTKLGQADNDTWKRYYDFRMKLEKEDEIIEEDEDDDGSIRVLHKCKDGLKDEVYRVGFEPWLQHTKQRVDDICWQDSDDIRSVTTSATIFAPYALPRALVLEHEYHFRSRYSSCEFYCYWRFRLVRFDGEPNGDKVQQKLALKYPKGWILTNPTYVADEEMEVLCSNGYIDPPRVQEEVDWVRVEDIDVQNFSPTTVRRMREWLFGSHKSTQVLDDFAFLRLIFASYGTADFGTLQGDAGYAWSPDREMRKEMIAEGVMGEDDDAHLSWLEYQARLVSGAIRPQDKYYVPYDLLEAKSEWGYMVLEICAPGKYAEDDEDLSEAPWLVWERAEKIAGGSLDVMWHRMMQAVMDR